MASVSAVYLAPRNTQNSQIHAQPHQPIVWWFIYSWLAACAVEMKPFKGSPEHLWTTDNTQKQATPKAALATFITDIFLICDDEKCVLLLHACKVAFLKSSHILYGYMHMY